MKKKQLSFSYVRWNFVANFLTANSFGIIRATQKLRGNTYVSKTLNVLGYLSEIESEMR